MRRYPLVLLVAVLGALLLSGLAPYDYDRLGHFAQGFVPAIVAREILLRTSPLRPGRWLFVLVTAVCLAISACYEFIEWWVAVAGGSSAEAFLGTQGDVWDTQWDMFMALIGAITAQTVLGSLPAASRPSAWARSSTPCCSPSRAWGCGGGNDGRNT